MKILAPLRCNHTKLKIASNIWQKIMINAIPVLGLVHLKDSVDNGIRHKYWAKNIGNSKAAAKDLLSLCSLQFSSSISTWFAFVELHFFKHFGVIFFGQSEEKLDSYDVRYCYFVGNSPTARAFSERTFIRKILKHLRPYQQIQILR